MAKNVVKTFVLCDNTKNDYGFNINVLGIDLSRFSANSVMLDSHIQSLQTIIGKWVNLRIEDGKLLADTSFWITKKGVDEIADGVEQEFINAVSIGFAYLESDMIQNPDGSWTLTKCELYECSLVAIGSNKNAVRLYSKTKEKWLEGEQLTLTLSSLFSGSQEGKTQITETETEQTMAKITLSAIALASHLGLKTTEVEQGELETKIQELHTAKLQAESEAKKYKERLEAIETAELQSKKTKADAFVTKLITEGKLKASDTVEIERFRKLATEDYDFAVSLADKMAGKVSLKTLTNTGNGRQVETDKEECFDYLQKHDTAKLASIKANDPDKYQELVAEYAKGKRYKK